MNESEVKKALDQIEPQAGAQERMYANILKKAAAQTERHTAEQTAGEKAPAAQKRRPASAWRRWGSLAACFAVILAAGIVLPQVTSRDEGSEPPIMVVSPFEDLDGSDGFEKLGFFIDAPAGAEDVTYCIYDGTIARVDFTVDGHEYTYEAAKLDGNFSRADGDAVGSTTLNAEYGAVLDRVSPDTWRAHWSCGDVSCYLTNFDGADEGDVTAVVQALISDA